MIVTRLFLVLAACLAPALQAQPAETKVNGVERAGGAPLIRTADPESAETVNQPFPPWFPKAPPLPPPQGEVIRVATVDELLAALDRVGPGGTIHLADGHYKLPRVIVFERKKDIVLRSASGDPAKVSLSGKGWDSQAKNDDIIRNNFIAGGPDCGIELWHAERIKLYHNTIWRPERNWSRRIRIGTGTARTDIVNNLVHGKIRIEGGKARLRQNLDGRLDRYFVEPASGNLALTPAATGAIDQGVSLPEVTDDIRRRPRTGRPDIGAWEFNGKTGASTQQFNGYILSPHPEAASARAARHQQIADRRQGPIMIVDRGASAFAPENTLEAYAAAMDYGADGCEIDIRRTALLKAAQLWALDLPTALDFFEADNFSGSK